MKAFVANIFVLVSLISVANSKYCHEKNTNLNYAQFISKFDQKKNASKPNEDCAKQLERFQISLVSYLPHCINGGMIREDVSAIISMGLKRLFR